MDAGFTTLQQPTIGSDNPFTKIHVWGSQSSNFEVWLKIIVEGPADKEPF
jgi:hypothetical protein